MPLDKFSDPTTFHTRGPTNLFLKYTNYMNDIIQTMYPPMPAGGSSSAHGVPRNTLHTYGA